jgi:hypothetical protein
MYGGFAEMRKWKAIDASLVVAEQALAADD